MKSLIYPYCENRTDRNGEYQVYIVFRFADNYFRIATGLKTRKRFTGQAFPRSEAGAGAKTRRLNEFLQACETFYWEHKDMDFPTLKANMVQIITGKVVVPKKLPEYINDFAALKTRVGTRKLYEATSRKVARYDATADFASVNVDWLKKFHAHLLAKGMSINGAAIELRNIRAVWNWAIDNELTEKYPFRKFKIPHERTRKRSLTAEQLAQLRDYPVEEWQREYRDMFMLSFYLIGINIGDLLLLKRLTDGRCVYHRQKTGRLYDIAAQPEAQEIMERYRGKKYLLAPGERYSDYKDYIRHMNDALKKIGTSRIVPDKVGKRRKVEYDALFPELTSYWARHTWATIAARLDIPKETIGKALGHSDFDSSTTDIYIDFDNRKIDEANRKVIDFLNKIKATS